MEDEMISPPVTALATHEPEDETDDFDEYDYTEEEAVEEYEDFMNSMDDALRASWDHEVGDD